MDGSGPVYLDPPSLDLWPNLNWTPDYTNSKKVNLNNLTKAEVASWKPGDTLLNGKMLRVDGVVNFPPFTRKISHEWWKQNKIIVL